MISTRTNPSGIQPRDYVSFLNRCFGEHWDLRSFEWYLRRGFNGRDTDIIIREEHGAICAGSAFCYRQLIDAHGAIFDVCIMITAATLPGERGRGHFAAMLDAGVERARANGCVAMLGFMTSDNASGRGLTRIGAYSIPSYYLFTAHTPVFARRHRWATRACSPPLHPAPVQTCTAQTSAVQFHYARPKDWNAQFVARSNPTRTVRIAHDAHAIIERVGAIDRLQWLGCPPRKTTAAIQSLAAYSAREAREFFMYTTNPAIMAAARRIGLRMRTGYIKVLPLDASSPGVRALAAAPWRVQAGDRM